MLNQIPEEIKSSTEKAESIIEWLADIWIHKKWPTILALFGVVLLGVGNRPVVEKVLSYLPLNLHLPSPYYEAVHGLVVVGVFTAALIVAVRTKRRKTGAPIVTDFTERKAIKGLRPFGLEDAELFARLQREESLRECLEAITDRDFRFGVLCGESGCGKTSFLQAGLWPRLMAQKTPHRCVYVKFSDLDPMDSLRQALAEQLQLPKDKIAPVDLIALLEAALSTDPKPLVLLFDQFEQFFVHRKTKEARKSFVQALAAWYKTRPPQPVKILVCIRGDYSDRLIELQKAMGYGLGVHNNFRLEKFTPKEATEVFRVIAETEGFNFSESFVTELTEQELADRDDGRISPVDLQILAWMIRGQTSAEERALNRVTYQKLGGIEGLLEKFLARALAARETEARRQAALKVLLGLTDLEHGVRTGVLTVPDLLRKLADTVPESEVRDAVEWLSRGDIRLITPSQRDGALGYELAHERLIPALRRLAGKELSEVDQANELLERRVNEWLGNDRDRRYLLRWRELRQIKQQQPYLVWGKREIPKKELLNQSGRRRKRNFLLALSPIVLIIVFWLGWLGWRFYEQQQFAQRRDQLARLGFELVDVPGGTFMMGDLFGDGYENEKPVHQVTLSAFKMSQHEITNEQYCAFLNADPGRNIEGLIYLETSRIVRQEDRYVSTEGFEKHPVVGVTWYGAKSFCDWMGGRLPTEAQWEYAARAAGDSIKYPWGNEEPDSTKANFWILSESRIATKPVGSYPPNALGLFDMAGNVWEWCHDWYGNYSTQPQVDPDGPTSGVSRVVRGGAFDNNPRSVRCGVRGWYLPNGWYVSVGFRVALSP
jgi:formylglycine-generating enzyme required for sulfatase activity